MTKKKDRLENLYQVSNEHIFKEGYTTNKNEEEDEYIDIPEDKFKRPKKKHRNAFIMNGRRTSKIKDTKKTFLRRNHDTFLRNVLPGDKNTENQKIEDKKKEEKKNYYYKIFDSLFYNKKLQK